MGNVIRPTAGCWALLGLLSAVMLMPPVAGHAQSGRKPTAQETAAVRACAAKYEDDVEAAEQHCIFDLVATPCANAPAGAANLDAADCYRIEQAIWDDLLNENYKSLQDQLDDGQKAKLRAMQRAWIGYRDTTCAFYMDKAQGSIAIPMESACAARETGRRALLLKFFAGL
jgi:uncharacterized protein YecT (DUF1311 family)